MNNKLKRIRNFTLAEIMIVVVIIGLVLAVAVPALQNKFAKAKWRLAQIKAKMLAESVNDYYMDVQKYPDSLAELVENTGDKKWMGSYLKEGADYLDPWGNEYIYEKRKGADFRIISYGADGQPGGEKFNRDVSNRKLE